MRWSSLKGSECQSLLSSPKLSKEDVCLNLDSLTELHHFEQELHTMLFGSCRMVCAMVVTSAYRTKQNTEDSDNADQVLLINHM